MDTGDGLMLARSYGDLARVLYHQGRHAEAEPLAKWVLTVRDASKKTSDDARFQSVYLLGVIHRAQRRYDAAEPLLKRALQLQQVALGADHPELALTLDALAGIYREQGKYKDAEPLYRKALLLRERSSRGESLELAESSEHLAVLLRKINRNDEADDMDDRAKAIRDAVATRGALAGQREPYAARHEFQISATSRHLAYVLTSYEHQPRAGVTSSRPPCRRSVSAANLALLAILHPTIAERMLSRLTGSSKRHRLEAQLYCQNPS